MYAVINVNDTTNALMLVLSTIKVHIYIWPLVKPMVHSTYNTALGVGLELTLLVTD